MLYHEEKNHDISTRGKYIIDDGETAKTNHASAKLDQRLVE